MKPGVWIAVGLALASCEAPAPPSPPASSAGPDDASIVARVGDISITAAQVAGIAAAQRVSPGTARDLAVHDALLASEARARGLDADREIHLAESAVLARVLVQDISLVTAAQGPVTDAELDAVTERHWTDLDRPDAARTVHAVVLWKKDPSADTRAKAAAVADAIRTAIAPAADLAAHSEPQRDPRGTEDPAIEVFRKAANAVAKGAFDVRVEPLPPVVADGRTLKGGADHLEEPFARAALALVHRGDVSTVIETSFGLHVILLLERIPGHTVPREERRAMVRDEVLSSRARTEKDRLLDGLRTRAAIDRSVDATLALVPVER